MNLASPATALSPAVKRLICDVGCEGQLQPGNPTQPHGPETESESGHTNPSNNGYNRCFVLSRGGLHLERIVSLFPASDDTAEYFEEAVRVLAPVFAQCQRVLSELSTEQIESTLMPRLCWTHAQEIFRDCLKWLEEQEEDNARNVLVLLLLSAILERALGNVYLLKGGQCPSMLKDLLVTGELDTVLGHSVMQILRVVIGPPMSLNLRNVAWHGFLGDEELPRRYCCFLVLLAASIGDILTRKGHHAIPQRPFFVWTPGMKDRLAAALQMSDLASAGPDLQGLTDLLAQCDLILPHTRQQWHLAFHLYTQGSFGYCLSLLLPVLEHVLRRAFTTVNNCPQRALTAQASALYTTFNEMLDQRLPDGSPNQLPAFLTTPCMDLLHDLLFYPEGPRVRDRLSHGEVAFGTVDQTLVAPFLHMAVFLALRLRAGESFADDELKDMERRVQSYTSVFHPVAILQYKFTDLLHRLEKTENSTLESTQHALTGGGGESQQRCVDNGLLQRAQDTVKSLRQWQPFSAVFDISSHSASSGPGLQLEGLKRISQHHIPTLFRWQHEAQTEGEGVGMKESECVGLLLRMTEECSTAAQQVQQMLQQRLHQLQAKQLRSRQRENLKKLVMSVPCLQLLMGSVSAFIGWTMQHLNDFTSLTALQRKTLQKFLKGTLQQCENLRTLTSPDKNKWTESVELLLQWAPSCQTFLLLWQQQQQSV